MSFDDIVKDVEIELDLLNCEELKHELDTYLFIFCEKGDCVVDPSCLYEILKKISESSNDSNKTDLLLGYMDIIQQSFLDDIDDLYSDIDEVVEEIVDGVEQSSVKDNTIISKLKNIFKK